MWEPGHSECDSKPNPLKCCTHLPIIPSLCLDYLFGHTSVPIQLLKKPSQCLVILESLTWHKSNKLANILRIIYIISQHLSFRKCPEARDLDKN